MQKSSFYILAFLISIFIVIRYFIGFNGMYGQDSFEYVRYAESLKNYLLSGEHPGDYFWPVGYPILIAIISLLTNDVFLAGQVLSMIGLIGILYYSIWFIRLINKERDQRIINYLFIFLILSPFILRGSLIVMPDVITAFFIIATLFHFLKSTQSGSHHFMWGVLFASLSIMMRYAAILIWLPSALYGLYHCLKNKQWMILILSILLSILIFLPHILVRKENSMEFIGHSWLIGWSPINFFKHSFTTIDGIQQNRFHNIIYAIGGIFHPGYFLPGIVFVSFLITKKQSNIFYIIGASIIIYLIFLAGIPYQNNRFIIIVIPIIIVLFYSGYQNMSAKWSHIIKYLYLPMIVLQLILFAYGFKIIYDRNRLEIKIAEYFRQNPVQNTYLFDMDVALKGYKIPTNYFNLWETEYKTFIPGSSVLFNEKKFSKQWEGKNVMKNWKYLNTNYRLKEKANFGDGWILYEII